MNPFLWNLRGDMQSGRAGKDTAQGIARTGWSLNESSGTFIMRIWCTKAKFEIPE